MIARSIARKDPAPCVNVGSVTSAKQLAVSVSTLVTSRRKAPAGTFVAVSWLLVIANVVPSVSDQLNSPSELVPIVLEFARVKVSANEAI
jgi:hypothetical protein